MAEYKAHSGRMRQLICDSMISLLEEKPFSKVTVRDILQKADIQRATFYRYFRDKYEVAEAINRELADTLVSHAFGHFYRQTPIDTSHQLLFEAKYRKVMDRMLPLRIENVDLSRTLKETFQQTYQESFPDADEFETYIAAQNFLFAVAWFSQNEFTPAQIREAVSGRSLSRWLARCHNISPQALEEFVIQQQRKSAE